eukprot:CAMPEP_0184662952 /NCGR_PEP_ID=MMETSP0308-20130426/45774_1 /TAXON_ID=38269 /ORGANISM="Gloeochaete witrockiana, Strain SAG 46.84" /LENGTH=332 /DNA_ID=CAMNT_0027105333 /DNA_START=87 /DNA_END=1082 /DNA_ORIENTATION=+
MSVIPFFSNIEKRTLDSTDDSFCPSAHRLEKPKAAFEIFDKDRNTFKWSTKRIEFVCSTELLNAPPKEICLEKYPAIDLTFPAITLLNEEPPIFRIKGMLSEEECDLYWSSVSEEVGYDPINRNRLYPLLIPVASAWSLVPLMHGGGWSDVMVAFACSMLGIASVAFMMSKVVHKAIDRGDKFFTGTKWTINSSRSLKLKNVHERYLQSLERLLKVDRSVFEPPTVTYYGPGEFQRAHLDTRTSKPWFAYRLAGGQRLANIVLYLDSLDESQGGSTKFHTLKLNVQPKKGDAVVFFPALRDGTVDRRMVHSGEPVLGGEKRILNVWMCEHPS